MQPEIYNNIYSNKNREVFVNYLKENIELNSNILEIGPGPGLSTELIKDFAKELTLIEPNKEYYDYLNKKFVNDKFKIYNTFLEQSPIFIYDSIIMVFNVINHIPVNKVDDFIKNLAIRSKKKTKIYFDMYNSQCVNQNPPLEVIRLLEDGRTLKISPLLNNNILNLTYKIDKKIIEKMNLYLHDVDKILEKFANNGFILQKKSLLGRSGDIYFYEVFGVYE